MFWQLRIKVVVWSRVREEETESLGLTWQALLVVSDIPFMPEDEEQNLSVVE